MEADDKYTRARKVAARIKKALEAVPDDLVVVITDTDIQVCDRDEFREHEWAYGNIETAPSIYDLSFSNKNIIGNSDKL